MFFKKKTLSFFIFFCIAATQPAYLFCGDGGDQAPAAVAAAPAPQVGAAPDNRGWFARNFGNDGLFGTTWFRRGWAMDNIFGDRDLFNFRADGLADEFANAGHRIVESLEHDFAEGGAGANALDNAMRNLARSAQTIIAPGGAGDAARQEAMGAIDRSAQDLTDIGDRNYARAVNLFSARTQAAIAAGGDLDNARTEFVGMVDRTTDDLNRQTTKLTDHWKAIFDNYSNAVTMMLVKNGLVIMSVFGGTVSCYYLSKYGWKRLFENRPKLLLNQTTRLDRLKQWFGFAQKPPLKMVLEPKLAAQLAEFLATTQAIRTAIKNGNKRAEYINVILCGPPGTGKTMFAEKLALESGMHLAKISAAGLAALGTEAIAEIDKLFAMDDVVIFIDEVDSLLGNRKELSFASDNYKTINHILGYTGKASNRRVLVMTTNLIENVDPALIDRATVFYVGLPDFDQRIRMIKFAIAERLFNQENSQLFIAHAKQVFNTQKIKDLATATEGMSNRNICSIINTIYSRALLAKNKYTITDTIINEAVALERQKQTLVQKPTVPPNFPQALAAAAAAA